MKSIKFFFFLLLFGFALHLNAADYRLDSLRFEGGDCTSSLQFTMIGEFNGTTADESIDIGDDDDDDVLEYDYVWINVYDANCNLIMTFRHQLGVGSSETEFFGTANLPALNVPTARPFTFYIYDTDDQDPNGPGDPLLQTYVDDVADFSCVSLPLLAAPNCLAPAEVPALSTWALMILSILALTLGVVYMRNHYVLSANHKQD